MPIRQDGFEEYTEEEIYQRLKVDLNDRLDVDAQPGTLVEKQLRAEAETLAEYQETALKNTYEAAYLQDASDRELEKVVDIIGITRNPAVAATGTVVFSRSDIPSTDYTIPSGTTLQDNSNTPIEFSTTELTSIGLIDDFDAALDDWEGDTDSVSIISSSDFDGANVVKLPNSSRTSIQTVDQYKFGSKFGCNFYANTESVLSIQFAYQDDQNYAEAIIEPDTNNLSMRIVVEGSEVSSVSENVTYSSDQKLYAELDWKVNDETELILYQSESKDTEIGKVEIAYNKKWTKGKFGIGSLSSVDPVLVEKVGTLSKTVNIKSDEFGRKTNVSANRITVIKSGLTGVERVVNKVPTGNSDYQNTDQITFRNGKDRENDESLRKRAFDNSSIGGSATREVIESSIGGLPTVKSIKVHNNRESTTVDGLPPHSFEAVVHGGTNKDIAKRIFTTASIDSHYVGGVNGIKETYEIQSDVSGDKETIVWSRPYEIQPAVTIDLVVDDTYAGDEEIKSIVANHIGGTDIDGIEVNGLGVGDDLYISILKQDLVDPESVGVWEVDSIKIDEDNDGTDDIIETSSGADVFQIGENEVAVVNARDGSIAINTTQIQQ